MVVTVVARVVLDWWDEADVAVQASVVEAVDVLGDGDLEVVGAAPRALVVKHLHTDADSPAGRFVSLRASDRTDDPAVRQ